MIKTKGTLTVLLGRRQISTGERWSLRYLAQTADVPKDLVYRLDAGTARYIDLQALARLCDTLECSIGDILIWDGPNGNA
ncbi:MAG: helix-turn-helix transcriptional regulator [Anaerolineae bacterium]|nr:helix-turn-helix transcriptional regulator [Anaerolineae bacterium]